MISGSKLWRDERQGFWSRFGFALDSHFWVPGPDSHSDPDPKFRISFSLKAINFGMKKKNPFIMIRMYFKILDPDLHEIDADANPDYCRSSHFTNLNF